MRPERRSDAAFVEPIPYSETPGAEAETIDAQAFMDEEQRRRKIGVPYEWADNWYADYERTVYTLRMRHAGAVRSRTRKHVIDGVETMRENFTTSGGSPWSVFYTLEEDATGAAVRLIVQRVRHGRAKGNP